MNKDLVATIISISGAALGLAGTVLSGIASKKQMQSEVAKEVAKALQK